VPVTQQRVDRAVRLIRAAPARIYAAFLDAEALARWLPPTGMAGEVLEFEPEEGGAFALRLTYREAGGQGKSSADADVVRGRFGPLVPDREVVWLTAFESDDPRFAGTMRMNWRLVPAAGGTEVEVMAENVPEGISAEDHAEGLAASLAGLAREVE
jgi:uncharacterized protein YndB with AHSA1/START domain